MFPPEKKYMSYYFPSFSFQNNLTEAQRNKLFVNRQAKMEKLKMEINEEVKSSYPPRNVVPVRKIRIIDGESCAILTIWSSNDDVSIFKEGNSYSICNINAYGRRYEFCFKYEILLFVINN